MFQPLDIIQYSTGKTYMVSEQTHPESVLVMGWKNGKPFGALRYLTPARCTLVGKATRPQERGDAWGYTTI